MSRALEMLSLADSGLDILAPLQGLGCDSTRVVSGRAVLLASAAVGGVAESGGESLGPGSGAVGSGRWFGDVRMAWVRVFTTIFQS